jgi:hypothetical protein
MPEDVAALPSVAHDALAGVKMRHIRELALERCGGWPSMKQAEIGPSPTLIGS